VRRADGGLVCRDHYDSDDGSPAAVHGPSTPSLSATTDLLPAVQSAVSCIMDVSDELCADIGVATEQNTSMSSSNVHVSTKHVTSGINNNNSKNKLTG